jgi:hypothetical protein
MGVAARWNGCGAAAGESGAAVPAWSCCFGCHPGCVLQAEADGVCREAAVQGKGPRQQAGQGDPNALYDCLQVVLQDSEQDRRNGQRAWAAVMKVMCARALPSRK